MIPGAVTRRVRSDTVELAVVEAGDPDRPTVVLVHGYPDTKEMWVDVAARLARRFRVVTYDVRGAGQSTAPRGGTAGYDLEHLVGDALAVAGAVSPDRPVHLVGHDWGSIQGWEAARAPRAMGRLASFTSISGPPLDHIRHWVCDRLRHPTPRNVAALADQARRSAYVAALSFPGVPALLWRTVGPDAARGAALYRRNLWARRGASPPGSVATVPVLLVVATRDRYVPPRLLEGLEGREPLLRRRLLDAPHWVPRTHPDELAGCIADFVDDVEAGPVAG